MNRKSRDDPAIERVLQEARPTEPSAELRERVMDTAWRTWKETAAEVPWQIPVRRLALSAAATFLIVSSANTFSSHAVGRWRADQPARVRTLIADRDETWEVPYDPFLQRLVAVRRSSARDPAAVIDSVERLREAFREFEKRIEETDTPDPTGFKNRLTPGGPSPCWPT